MRILILFFYCVKIKFYDKNLFIEIISKLELNNIEIKIRKWLHLIL